MIAGVALQTMVLILLIYRTNWNKEVSDIYFSLSLILIEITIRLQVEQASERMRKWGGEDIMFKKPPADHL